MVVGTAVGEVAMSFPSAAAALPMVGAGKVRALGVTSIKRVSAMPSVPTLNESGLQGYNRSNWYGLLAPVGVQKEIIVRIHAIIDKAVNTQEVRAMLTRQGLEPEATTPNEFESRIRSDITQNAQLIKMSGAKTE